MRKHVCVMALLCFAFVGFNVSGMKKDPDKLVPLKKDGVYQLKVTSDGNIAYLVFGGEYDNTYKMEKIQTKGWKCVEKSDVPGSVLRVFGEQTFFLMNNDGGRLYDIKTKKEKSFFNVRNSMEKCSVISRDGAFFVCTKLSRKLLEGLPGISNLKSDSIKNDLRIYKYNGKKSGLYKEITSKDHNKFICMQFSPKANVLVVGLQDGSLQLIDLDRDPDCKHIKTLCPYKDVQKNDKSLYGRAVTCIGFDRSGKVFVTASNDKNLYAWDMGAGKCKGIFSGHEIPVSCVSISPDGRFLASKEFVGAARIWNMKDFSCLMVINNTNIFAKEVLSISGWTEIAFVDGQKQVVVLKPFMHNKKNQEVACLEFTDTPKICWTKKK